MDQKVQEQLEQLRGTANGEALRFYLDEQIKRITDIKILNPENVESTKIACQVLEGLFKFLEVKQIQTNKNKYN